MILLLKLVAASALSLTGSTSRTDLSQLANGIWEIHAGCPSFLRVSSVAKIGYIPQFEASNSRDQEVSSDLARMAASDAVPCALNFGAAEGTLRNSHNVSPPREGGWGCWGGGGYSEIFWIHRPG